MPGWKLHNVADHCSMRTEIDTQLFPKKPTSWLTFGHMPNLGRLPRCNGVCSCMTPGANRHKFVICNNDDMHEKQIVIKNVFAKGRILYVPFYESDPAAAPLGSRAHISWGN